MQRELPTIDFTGEAEVRSKAEYRRTEEVTNLLKDFFAWWTPRLRQWTPGLRQWMPRLRQSGRPILEAVGEAQHPVAAGRS
jgi:hypothetical protein